jgi:hypothetical protein
LEAQMQEREIERLLGQLSARGVSPLLVKGWACARFYPEPGLRPFGDVDLFVHPEQITATEEVLGVPVNSSQRHLLDVKSKVPSLYGRTLSEMVESAQRVSLRGATACVPSHEDHLRLLCLHFLRHGAWRPLWLCDIAAALEARPAGFDWQLCLGPDGKRADWIACALGLAHQLLGACVEGTPVEERARRLPPWLLPCVLREWETPQVLQHAPHELILVTLRSRRYLRSWFQALLKRWPNPIEAPLTLGVPLSVPPLPSQAIYFALLNLRFMRRLPALLRQ